MQIPYGISDFRTIRKEDYLFIDKTQYIEKLEKQRIVMYVRPRRFGKSLFTSILDYYYAIDKKEEFEQLFKGLYIYDNQTPNKNLYYIMNFNFSRMEADSKTELREIEKQFKDIVVQSLVDFIKRYNLQIQINTETTAANALRSVLSGFKNLNLGNNIYVIIDEYDHFANDILGFKKEEFKNLVAKNGKIRKWYEILKKGTESVVDRIFITGVAPITLDSLTSGFNIGKDITQDEDFNEMMGFTLKELVEILNNQEITKEEQEKILPIMKENYDGYKFSLSAENHIYNSNMCLYFLSDYIRLKRIPDDLIDMNIASDYSKIGKMLDLCKGENRQEILRKTVQGEPIVNNIVKKFNPAIEFTETDMISMLYYLGYLTIYRNLAGIPELTIPNKVMKEIYASYFMQLIDQKAEFRIDSSTNQEILIQLAMEGRIDKIVEVLRIYLNNL